MTLVGTTDGLAGLELCVVERDPNGTRLLGVDDLEDGNDVFRAGITPQP